MIGKSLLGFFIVITIAVLVRFDHVNGQTVSPKLDFNDSKEVESKSSTKRPPPSFNQQDENDGGGGGGVGGGDGEGRGGSNGGSGKSGPKIHGVRVTVDTGDNQKGSKESKESVEITESKNKKRVGIHTDITFEITGDIEDSNSTSSSQRHDKEENDASVPIFKGGRKSTTTTRPRKPYDPRTHWSPNYSAERRRYGSGDSSFRPSSSHYPHNNVPVYPANNGDDIYRGIDSWSSFIPITSTWTTERSYYEPYKPSNAVGGYRVPSWKPCYCASSSSSSSSLSADNRRRRDSIAHPTSSIIQIVDKLDSPFSSSGKK
ncbi:uncharacterized protein LOC129952303 [Eupeodes corollae]|uniref:uncharacterized protein LOC129952303 n=1 Tax=Eupeodes corollae TaxID=290404 RepID=UPI0024912C69|nr:uncharacterized protein LOC129952303 [Eupeodes corollae]